VVKVGAVVLAAGLSSRMGQAKQLLDWGGKPMVRHVVEVLTEAALTPVIVVIGHQRAAVEQALAGTPAQAIFNPDYADGSMLRSLQVGLQYMLGLPAAQQPAAILAVLSDQPRLAAARAQWVVEQWQANGAAIVAPTFRGQRGHPILFARTVWPAVLGAAPVGSPRAILEQRPDQVALVEADDDAIVRDIDTPLDYQHELARRV
jgi:molybdenum cofactor cytidylyltransferase